MLARRLRGLTTPLHPHSVHNGSPGALVCWEVGIYLPKLSSPAESALDVVLQAASRCAAAGADHHAVSSASSGKLQHDRLLSSPLSPGCSSHSLSGVIWTFQQKIPAVEDEQCRVRVC